MAGENEVLVTIGVLAYNSANTILETLDSTYNQTFPNIELIISDDGSTDNTINIVSDWLGTHKERFVKSILLTSDTNTGTPANCNRLFEKAEGEYIKYIAGDDILLPNCIYDYVNFFLANSNIQIAYSNYLCFHRLPVGKYEVFQERFSQEIINGFDCEPCKQLYFYIENSFNISPSVFMCRKLVEQLGGFNEKYKVFEDTPFYTKVLVNNIKIHHLDAKTVLYRMNEVSTTTANPDIFYKKTFIDCRLLFRKDIIYKLYKWYNLSFWIKEYSFRFQYWFTIVILKNERTKINNFIYHLVKSCNPYYLIEFVRNKIC